MDNNIAISIKNLVKKYNGQEAVDNISFDIQEGEFFGFLGPNGAGKTSTINAICGIANFNSGIIEVFGKDVVKNYREARSFIGLSPQEFNFDPFLSVQQIMVYQGGYYGIPTAECTKRAEELMKLFGIYDKRKSTFRALSGGLKRRLTIARALIHKPKILILDEPTAGMNQAESIEMTHLIQKIRKEGTTILLIEHRISLVMQISQCVYVLDHGEKIAEGTPTEIQSNPKVIEA